jgi:oligopeptide/dipeptide ABC transporter ATP-binding protein
VAIRQRGPHESLPPVAPPLVQVRDLAVHYKVPAIAPPGSRMPQDLPDLARIMFSAIVPTSEINLRAVDGIDLHIEDGETLGLVGESGCGKSTLGRAFVRLEEPARGKILLDDIDLHRARGRKLKDVRRSVQMIFQDPYASLNPRMTVGDTILEPMRALGVGANERERKERLADLMERCGLDPRMARRYPHEFSGGQRQRVAIARALAPGPRLIVADEPVSALDVSIQAQILNLLEELQRSLSLTMLFIAHDLAVVRHISHRIAVMYLGRLVEVAPSPLLCADPLHPYTRALLSAVPSPDPKTARTAERIVLKGDPPSPLRPPKGCAFWPRCSEAVERCKRETPVLKIGKLGRPVACHVAHDET